MAIVQAKLKETVNKGKMTSFDRIANMLDTGGEDDMTEVVEQEEEPHVPSGINKAPIHSTRRSAKRKLKARQAKEVVVAHKKKKEKPKPRYFCQF